jgi:hypothetical protein
MYLKETNQESPALLRDNRKCQADGRHNFKKRRWMKEVRGKTVPGNGGAQPFIAFWRPAICVACLLQNESRPSHSKSKQFYETKGGEISKEVTVKRSEGGVKRVMNLKFTERRCNSD